MKILFIITCLVSILTTGCHIHGERKRISDGIYFNTSKEEMISIQGDRIDLLLCVNVGVEKRIIRKEYENYTLLDNGNFWPTPTKSRPITSTDLFLGFGLFSWTFDGKNIIRENDRTGEVMVFFRSEEVNHPSQP